MHSCGALVLLFDHSNRTSWESLKAGWDAPLLEAAPEIVLVVGEGESEEIDPFGDLHGEISERVAW